MLQLAAVGADAGHLSRPQGHGVGRIRVHRRNSHEQQRWERDEAAASGYRVDGSREHCGEKQNRDVTDVHARGKPMVTGAQKVTSLRQPILPIWHWYLSSNHPRGAWIQA